MKYTYSNLSCYSATLIFYGRWVDKIRVNICYHVVNHVVNQSIDKISYVTISTSNDKDSTFIDNAVNVYISNYGLPSVNFSGGIEFYVNNSEAISFYDFCCFFAGYIDNTYDGFYINDFKDIFASIKKFVYTNYHFNS